MNSWERFSSDMKGKHVLVFGLGLLGGGADVVRTCVEAGAVVRVTDEKSAVELKPTLNTLSQYVFEQSFGKHSQEDIDWAEIIIKNPSVSSSIPLIQYAHSNKKLVTTAAALYLKYTGAKTIGVTGTRGKTTTTMMIYAILKASFPNVLLGGNMQNESMLGLLHKETAQSITVLELSSWQLEGCHWAKVSPHVAVVTNLFEDHLNRYDNMETYAYDKAAIVMYQTSSDIAVLNKKDIWYQYFAKAAKGTVEAFDATTLPKDVVLQIPGEHNRLNAGAAVLVARALECSEEIIRTALMSFTGVPFRFETIAQKHGVTIINDTTSTTPVALQAALRAVFQHPHYTKESRIHLIAGGTTKNLQTREMVQDMNMFADQIYLLEGTGTQEILPAIDKKRLVGVYMSLKNALTSAMTHAKSPDIILFSPGFTSFGMFQNEFDRGEQFNALVRTL